MCNQQEITIDLEAVVRPARLSATLSAEVMGWALNRVGTEDWLAPSAIEGHTIQFMLPMPAISADQRAGLYRTWLLDRAFQELQRGLRATLELAYLAASAIRLRKTTYGEFQAFEIAKRKRAQGAKFPDLLASVNALLVEPMPYSNEMLTWQKVRNCLEHRGGLVAAHDVEAETGVLTLKYSRPGFGYHRNGEEVEIAPGHVVDDGTGQPEVQIWMKLFPQSRSFQIGESVNVSAAEFIELAMACCWVADDLLKRLFAVSEWEQARRTADAAGSE